MICDTKRGPNITTYTNVAFFMTDPTPDMIHIEDIAHGLSNICRYVGQCQPFYSVAEHSIRMCAMIEEKRNWENYEDLRNAKLAALLHDAPEAYIGDVSSGLKHLFPKLMQIENDLLAVILEKYEVSMIPEVKKLDEEIRVVEVLSLFPRGHAGWNFKVPAVYHQIVPWSPQVAKDTFLKKFAELTGGNYSY